MFSNALRICGCFALVGYRAYQHHLEGIPSSQVKLPLASPSYHIAFNFHTISFPTIYIVIYKSPFSTNTSITYSDPEKQG
uniref:Uncharacterized protein n=1 Tax=Aegilops tauschii subsp. strangulata TaxID=200361 RepID=A0A453R2R7_AEGTS